MITLSQLPESNWRPTVYESLGTCNDYKGLTYKLVPRMEHKSRFEKNLERDGDAGAVAQ